MLPSFSKTITSCAAILLFFSHGAADTNRTPRDRALDGIFAELSDLKQKLHCYQVEKEILEEKMSQQESMVESFRQQLRSSQTNNDEMSKGKVAMLEKKIAQLEKANESLMADLRQFKTHANDTSNSLNQFKSKLSNLERDVNGNMSHMKNALESLISISKKGASSIDISASSATGVYKVKSGDSLEKIARAHQISVESLKNWNQLTSDRIKIGQELKIEAP
jgi:septal ring factor EnvC (AmiA/AmiB activator)